MLQIPTPEHRDSAPGTAAPLLQVRNLVVEFASVEGTHRAVDHVSFDVRPGRTMCIVGESGCGKSVTARAIMRIEDKQCSKLDGNILLRGEEQTLDLARYRIGSKVLREVRGRRIGIVFQEPNTSFSPVHTIGNQLVEAIRVHRPMSREEASRAAVDQLESVGVPDPTHVMAQYSWQLSGGLRQRAMIAMALVCDPAILIADEPTTALDVTTQAQILNLLRTLREEREMAVILITHDLGVVAQTADEVLVMYLGQAVEQGDVRDVIGDPKHPYTQLLLRSMPSVTSDAHAPLQVIDGAVPHSSHGIPGCLFHPRCPSAMAGVCNTTVPAQHVSGRRHSVSCHLYTDNMGT